MPCRERYQDRTQRQRFGRRTLLAALSLATLLGAGTAARAQVEIGNTNSNNTFPFGAPGYVGAYQQVYAGSAFSGPVSISAIAFKTLALGLFAGNTIADDLTISLSTTSAPVGALSTDYAANRGADFTTVFSGTKTIVCVGDNTYDVVFTITPFVYDPSQGNLLMDVFINSNIGQVVPFVAGVFSSETGRVFNFEGTGTPLFLAGEGLRTRFTVGSVNAVPEPSEWAAMGVLGLALGGLVVRKRRAR